MIKSNSLDKYTLYSEGGSTEEWKIKFPSPILNYIISKNFIYTVILTEPSVQSEDQRNIFCVLNSNGEIIWDKTANKSISRNNIYTEIRIFDNNYLIAWDWNGNKEKIEITTGRVINRNFMK